MSDLRTKMRGDAVTIRRTRPADATPLLHLAALDDAAPLDGDVLVAEVDGELWAALCLDDGRRIADPFRPTAEAVALLELRASLVGTQTDEFPLRAPSELATGREGRLAETGGENEMTMVEGAAPLAA